MTRTRRGQGPPPPRGLPGRRVDRHGDRQVGRRVDRHGDRQVGRQVERGEARVSQENYGHIEDPVPRQRDRFDMDFRVTIVGRQMCSLG